MYSLSYEGPVRQVKEELNCWYYLGDMLKYNGVEGIGFTEIETWGCMVAVDQTFNSEI